MAAISTNFFLIKAYKSLIHRHTFMQLAIVSISIATTLQATSTGTLEVREAW